MVAAHGADTVWTVVVAAGSGTRFGAARPKQYLDLGDGRVLDHALSAARAASDGVVLVVGATFADDHEPAADVVVVGGDTRSASARRGLDAVPAGVDIVIIHDGARPMASPALFQAVLAAVRAGADAAIPGIAVADTIKRVADGHVVETLPRQSLVAVQTPQAFRAEVLRAAYDAGQEGTDDAAVVEALGGRVAVVAGDPVNRKVTTPDDLVIIERLLVEQDRRLHPAPPR